MDTTQTCDENSDPMLLDVADNGGLHEAENELEENVRSVNPQQHFLRPQTPPQQASRIAEEHFSATGLSHHNVLQSRRGITMSSFPVVSCNESLLSCTQAAQESFELRRRDDNPSPRVHFAGPPGCKPLRFIFPSAETKPDDTRILAAENSSSHRQEDESKTMCHAAADVQGHPFVQPCSSISGDEEFWRNQLQMPSDSSTGAFTHGLPPDESARSHSPKPQQEVAVSGRRTSAPFLLSASLPCNTTPCESPDPVLPRNTSAQLSNAQDESDRIWRDFLFDGDEVAIEPLRDNIGSHRSKKSRHSRRRIISDSSTSEGLLASSYPIC